jgi:hypothetical protein
MPHRSRSRHIAAGLPGQDRGAAPRGEEAMRSLWRLMALRWLGGEGSEALAGDSALIDFLPSGPADPVFRIARDPRASGPACPPSPAPDAPRGKVSPRLRSVVTETETR